MKNYLGTILFVIILFSACQKEVSVEQGAVIEATQNLVDSNRLIKYVEFDTAQISGLDTLDIAKYNYDNLRRLTLLEYTEFEGAGVKINLYKTNLFYNGTDTLPFKRINSHYNLPALNLVRSDTNFYAYANGRIVLDSNSYGFAKFQYTNNKILETTLQNLPGALINSNTYYMTRLNGNLVLQKDTISGGSVYQNFSFNYDNKKNPFYNLPISSLEYLRPYYKLELYSEEMIFEKNNPIEIFQTSSTSTFHFKYSYEYNLNGYPKIARAVDQTDPTIYYKVKFFYTSL